MKTEIIGEVERNYNDYGFTYMSIKNKEIMDDERMMDKVLSKYEGKKVRLVIEVIE